jgi:hypothetical protein
MPKYSSYYIHNTPAVSITTIMKLLDPYKPVLQERSKQETICLW